VGLKLVHVSKALAEEHYAEHKGKPFFEGARICRPRQLELISVL
jgi:nucleoside diphosphate kinase